MSIRIGNNVIIGGGGQVSDPNFLPNGTIITVETDGSGQFTKLSDAINYLTGKWSNGVVIIKLGEGDFVETEQVTIDGRRFNLGHLVLQGTSKSSSVLNVSQLTSDKPNAIFILYCNNLSIITMAIQTSQVDVSTTGNVIRLSRSFFNMNDCLVNRVIKVGNGVALGEMSTGYLDTSNISNCNNGVACNYGAIVTTKNMTYTNITNKTISTKGLIYEL